MSELVPVSPILGDGTYWSSVVVVDTNVSDGRQWRVGYVRPTGYNTMQGVAQLDDGTFVTNNISSGGATAYGYWEVNFPSSPVAVGRTIKAIRIWVNGTNYSYPALTLPSTGSSIMAVTATAATGAAVEVFRYGTLTPTRRTYSGQIPYRWYDNNNQSDQAWPLANVTVTGPVNFVAGSTMNVVYDFHCDQILAPDGVHTAEGGFRAEWFTQHNVTGVWTSRGVTTIGDASLLPGGEDETRTVSAVASFKAGKVVLYKIVGATYEVVATYLFPATFDELAVGPVALPVLVYPDVSMDAIPVKSTEVEGDVADKDDPVTPTLGVDLDGDGSSDYKVVKTPNVAGDPGSGYKVEIIDKNGNTVAVGYLPPGTDPNGPWTFRVDGRFLVVMYGGQVIVTYLIPQANYNLNVSTFWIGYIDPDGTHGDPILATDPPLGGFQYQIDTGFWETLFPAGAGQRVKNKFSEAIWERADGSFGNGRIFYDPDGNNPTNLWGVTNGQTAPIQYQLALRLWEAGLSRFLSPIPTPLPEAPVLPPP